MALDGALRSRDTRHERLREAREALETFKLVERTPDQVPVPLEVRRRVDWALSELEHGKLELADSDVRSAGGILRKAMVEFQRRNDEL
jgi:hypothetical protein